MNLRKLKLPTWALILGGLVLLAVPTLFTVFPTLTDWDPRIRQAILGGWVLAAGAALVSATNRDKTMDKLSEAALQEQKDLLIAAVETICKALLTSGAAGIPKHYEATAYVWDGTMLVPFWPPWDDANVPDPRSFPPGAGATGTAWDQRSMVFVKGSAVANEEYGLSPEQQAFFSSHRTVIATPIAVDDEQIGVLTVLSIKDDSHFESEEQAAILYNLANVFGIVIHQLLESPAELVA